jgi:gamma-glutamylcyclotransferase (GGCT)/AIG2-like uncharacterized protein YtfP
LSGGALPRRGCSLLFVYGTLMRGEMNHERLAGARFLGEARSAPGFTLLDLGPWPALRDEGGSSVPGELYEVDDALLDVLDVLEGHPDWYLRQEIPLADGGSAWAYVLPRKFCQGGRAVDGWRGRPGPGPGRRGGGNER